MSKLNPNPGSPEIVHRRSQRVIVGVAINVLSEGTQSEKAFQETTQTLVVNAHGALIALAAKVHQGQLLRLKNRATQEQQLCKVMHLGQSSGELTQVGIEFETPSPNFWRIAFPPDDWVVPDQVPAGQESKSNSGR